jgi:cobalt/nickel transport system permease protein
VNDAPDTRDPSGLPGWLLRPQSAPPPAGRSGISFVTRLVTGLGRFLEEAFSGDAQAARPGLLQGLDAPAKVAGLLALVVTAALTTRIAALLLLLAVAVALIPLSRLHVARFALRAWLVVPLFTLVVALPATTSWVTSGETVLPLWGSGSITASGLLVAARLVLRVTVAVTFGVLLAVTTRWDVLMRALRTLRVPRTFVFVLTSAYRYVFQLLRLLQDLATARLARSVGPASRRDDRRFIGAAAGTLFVRSQALGEEVYLAMLARGYTGEVVVLEQTRFRTRDAVWLLAVAAVIALVVAAQLRGV